MRGLCSTLGTIVNGEPIGDHFRGDDAPLRAGENELIAGGVDSPFVFYVFIACEAGSTAGFGFLSFPKLLVSIVHMRGADFEQPSDGSLIYPRSSRSPRDLRRVVDGRRIRPSRFARCRRAKSGFRSAWRPGSGNSGGYNPKLTFIGW